ncbi:Hypothetical predicted protein [Paramuricea clavata]|uniref:Uncharacterized protein n=1 Tax=Paramuricea clavata TaxID=317549 RepID=A0A6S7GEF4_PARCT|nr:Hypothetical predicted protein [Paramuricea clavata]
MILEELVSSFLSFCSSLMIQTPPIHREQRQFTLIFEETHEQNEVYDGLIHREYEQQPEQQLPYYEHDISDLVQPDGQPSRDFAQSFLRSFQANVGLVMAVVFILGLLTLGIVYVDLNTTDACIEWMHNNYSIPRVVKIFQIVGMSFELLPLFTWFPASIVMLWGFKEFKKNYLSCLLVCQLVVGSITCVYRIVMFDEVTPTTVHFSKYRLPVNVLFTFSIICGAYLVARKFKKVNPEKQGKVKKAIIAVLTPGISLPVTAIAKYLVLRKSSEIITPDRAFVLCYFLRGASIVLYRTMQSHFQNIWLFIGLSLLHGVSNVLSKATLSFRTKMWKFFIKCLNNTCCGARLEVQPLNSPRIRRFNADLEIQNILFEYTTVILSQAYLACYLVMSFDISPWQVIQGSLTRIAINLALDFVFNMISVFIQIHYYDIPMRKVWLKYWPRHVAANALIIICMVSYFGPSLVSVFAGYKYIWKEYKLRNCTSIF